MRRVRGIVLFLPHGAETQTCSSYWEHQIQTMLMMLIEDRANINVQTMAMTVVFEQRLDMDKFPGWGTILPNKAADALGSKMW